MENSLPHEAGAIILAGGESRRMGSNKCLLPYRGLPLIQHVSKQLRPLFQELLVSTNDQESYAFLELPVIPDEIPGQGPLMGIASALARARYDWNLVVAADIPEIPSTLVARMHAATPGHTCVVPVTRSGRSQPLFAFYHRSLLGAIRASLRSGQRRAHELLALSTKCEIAIDDTLLGNLNTPEDYGRSGK